ncbi:Eco29kI family restriction endonuclease [Gemmatimonas sp.]|uniref:Eco29kI family restriction endonuclease n=1 Tax=Gemmatimonas sp. TaxID=1962908 RepID=UPI0035660379
MNRSRPIGECAEGVSEDVVDPKIGLRRLKKEVGAMTSRRSQPGLYAASVFDERPVLALTLDASLHTVAQPLSSPHPKSPGAYLQLYRGFHPLYERIAVPKFGNVSLAAASGWPIYAGSTLSLHERAGRHRKNLASVIDLEVDDFLTVLLPTETLAGALMIERLVIDQFRPVFNQPFLGGFGSGAQGGSRHDTQKTAPFSVLHSGRRACTGTPTVTPRELADRVESHLSDSVPAWWMGASSL